MTLKLALSYLENSDILTLKEYTAIRNCLEKLIEEVAETSYRKGAIDGTAGTITYESPEAFWKSHKERWLGK